MAVGTERGCGGGLRSGAGAAASLYAGGRGSELLWCVCFGAGGALGACVGEGRRAPGPTPRLG